MRADNDCIRLLIFDVALLIKYNTHKTHVIVIVIIKLVIYRPAKHDPSITMYWLITNKMEVGLSLESNIVRFVSFGICWHN